MKSDTYNIGDKIEFDNGLIKSIATIKDISRKKIFDKINGEDTRYILNCNNTTQLCSPSQIIKKL